MVKPSIIPEGARKEDAKEPKGKETSLPAFAVIPLGTDLPPKPDEPLDEVTAIPVVNRPRKLGVCLCLSAILLALLLIIGLAFALFLGHSSSKYSFRCGVKYDGYPDRDTQEGEDLRPSKTLEEDIEVDPFEGYERIEIPEQDYSERLTILHDFIVNFTAYRLWNTEVCYITWLDKDIVMGPREFVERAEENPDFLTEHYETVYETYRAVLPKLSSVSSGFGNYIPLLCGSVESYWIEKIPADELEAWEEYWEHQDGDVDDDDDDRAPGGDDSGRDRPPAPPRSEHRHRRGAVKKTVTIHFFDGKLKGFRVGKM